MSDKRILKMPRRLVPNFDVMFPKLRIEIGVTDTLLFQAFSQISGRRVRSLLPSLLRG